MRSLFVVIATLFAVSPALAETDYVEVWHACDEAAVDEGFAGAGLLSGDIRGSQVKQIAGRWEGQTLAIVTAATSSGQVFCMAREDGRVVHYKFKGHTIIERD